ncbi:homoserine/homoserine lactone efflux protein [Paraburkholderia youngii]|uniref:LysE family translocator n=1 Tax=Paraburkholderia youngii TaxID=2782701 RepID=A0ABX2NTL2_9BURK|nr:LysE family translocator [Paraburkholderia youngii]NUX58289.1 LysE family translocator [Paraburkholderia youngii]NVI07807.1 LysE family translocator [Paraburkholderia youngii]
MSFHTWLLFAAAYLLTTISPGPNVLLVIRNSVRYGSRGAAASVAGNLLAQGVVVALVALGVGAVLTTLPPLFVVMKVLGAGYLMYLGIRQLRGGGNRQAAQAARPTGVASPADTFERSKVFREALLVSGSNPKTMIFLSAFMPQFIDHERGLPEQFIVMYLTIAVTVALVHTIYSLGVQGIHKRVGASRWIAAIKRGSGLVFVALGIKLLSAQRA